MELLAELLYVKKLSFFGASIVLAHGCFDALHLGHVRHLLAAKAMGDVLVVTVTADAHVGKGEGRPIFNQHERCEMLAALECVDYVAVNDAPDAVEAIRLLRPAWYVKGGEYDGNPTPALDAERLAVELYGGRWTFTHEKEWHTTDLLRNR